MENLKTLFLIALGGGLGSVLRYLTTVLVSNYFPNSFPYATFFTNILGCLLIGILFGYFEQNEPISQNLKFFLITGICGGYTTFSAFSLESNQLFQSNQFFLLSIYIGLSVTIGFLATWFGLYLTKGL